MSSKVREALEDSNGLLEELALLGEWGESARAQIAENNAALAEPPRNCDVGNEYEQNERFVKFCREHEKGCGLGWGSKEVGHPKVTCPAYKCLDCGLVWAQMPYESEVRK